MEYRMEFRLIHCNAKKNYTLHCFLFIVKQHFGKLFRLIITIFLLKILQIDARNGCLVKIKNVLHRQASMSKQSDERTMSANNGFEF